MVLLLLWQPGASMAIAHKVEELELTQVQPKRITLGGSTEPGESRFDSCSESLA